MTRHSPATVVAPLSCVFVLVALLAACTSPAPEEAKASSHAALSADGAGDDDDATQTQAPTQTQTQTQGDDDDSTAQPQHGFFDNWCTGELQIDDNNNPYCAITVWCGGWSTRSVLTTGVDGPDPCHCECQ